MINADYHKILLLTRFLNFKLRLYLRRNYCAYQAACTLAKSSGVSTPAGGALSKTLTAIE